MVVVTEGSANPAQTSAETKAILRFSLPHVSVLGWEVVQGALFSAWLNVAFEQGGRGAVLRDLKQAIEHVDHMSRIRELGAVAGHA